MFVALRSVFSACSALLVLLRSVIFYLCSVFTYWPQLYCVLCSALYMYNINDSNSSVHTIIVLLYPHSYSDEKGATPLNKRCGHGLASSKVTLIFFSSTQTAICLFWTGVLPTSYSFLKLECGPDSDDETVSPRATW